MEIDPLSSAVSLIYIEMLLPIINDKKKNKKKKNSAFTLKNVKIQSQTVAAGWTADLLETPKASCPSPGMKVR